MAGVMDSMNSSLEVGGEKEQREADEIPFRCLSESRKGVQGVTFRFATLLLCAAAL